MSDRLQHYLTVLMNNPGKYVRINKLKNQCPKRDNSKERRELMGQIETALKVMGIPYTRVSDRYRIKVNEEPEKVPHLDPGSCDVNQYYQVKYHYGQVVGRPVSIIVDDMT